uniref:C2 domain-containing protein n=1 Tax=Parastrongyloides trichosuri TaxID=131310 RepID=A0A0N5A205_PARTI
MKRHTDSENEMLFKGYSVDEPLNILVLVKNAVLHGPPEEFHCYVTVKLQNVKSTTPAVKGNNPSWEQEFIFETNRLDQGLLIELWNKGVLWDKLIGVHHIPLTMIPYSPVPGRGYYIGIDKEFEMRNGVTIGSRTPTGHTLMIDVRFELPFDAQEQEIIAFQTKLQSLNNTNYHNVPHTTNYTPQLINIATPTQNFLKSPICEERGNSFYGNDLSIVEDSNRHPFIRSGVSEDSDYTSDVSFPINHHQQNSSTSHWNNQIHPPNGYVQRNAGEYSEEVYHNYHMDINCQEISHMSEYNEQFIDRKAVNQEDLHGENIYYENPDDYNYLKQYNNISKDEEIAQSRRYDSETLNDSSEYYSAVPKYDTQKPNDNYYMNSERDIMHMNEINSYQNFYPTQNVETNQNFINDEVPLSDYNISNNYQPSNNIGKNIYEEEIIDNHEYNSERYDEYKTDTPTSSRTLYESDRTNVPYFASSATASDSENRKVPVMRQVSNSQQRRDAFRKDSTQMRTPLDDEYGLSFEQHTSKMYNNDDIYYPQDIEIYRQDDYESVSDYNQSETDWKNNKSNNTIDNMEPLSYNSRPNNYYGKKSPEFYVEYDTVPIKNKTYEDNNYLESHDNENYDNFVEETSEKPYSNDKNELKSEDKLRREKYKELWKKAYCEVCKQVGLKVSFLMIKFIK